MIKYNHLEGLQFIHGSQDCYTILQRFYLDNYSIVLRDYARPDEWWNQGLNLYMDNFAKEGFSVVDIQLKDMQIGDVMLMAVMTEQACHCGIYIGGNNMLHHFFNRMSKVDQIKGMWRNTIVAVVRHKDVKAIKIGSETVDVLDRILPHKRAMVEETYAKIE